MTRPNPRSTQRLLLAARAGARITTLDGVPVLLDPRTVRDCRPWVDQHGRRYSGAQCIAHEAQERPQRLTPRQIREIAQRTGIDWNELLGRAG